jgi:hypothetical protein
VAAGKTIADGYLELRVDDSKVDADVKAKSKKIANTFGNRLNSELSRLNIDSIDMQANPREALKAIDQTQRKLKELSDDAATVEMRVRAERAQRELDRFRRNLALDPVEVPVEADTSAVGRQLQTMQRQLKALGLDTIDINANPDDALAAIAETELKLKALASDATTVEVKIKTDQAASELAKLKKLLGDIGGKEDGGKSAENFAGGFSSKIGPLLAKAPVSPAILAAAAAVAPEVGALISAAVIGGAGIGGVIGGLTLVKDDPRVKAAGTALGKSLLGTLKADAAPFVEPALAAAALVEARFAQANSKIQSIFQKSSGFLGPLVDGATKGVDGILRGIDALVTKGKPVIDALSDSFVIVGNSVGDALSTIAGGSEEAGSALTVLAKLIGGTVEVTGYLVRGLTELYGVISYIPGKLKDFGTFMGQNLGIVQDSGKAASQTAVEVTSMAKALFANVDAATAAARANGLFVATAVDVKNQQQLVTDAQEGLNNSILAMAPAGARAAQIATGLTKAIQALHGAQMGATDANEAYEASWDALSESIKSNGRSLNIHSAAGRSNRDALEAVASATRDAYTADIASGVAIGTATRKHDDRIRALKEEAHRNGLNRTETDKLVHTYGDIPKGKTTKLVVAGVDSIASALKDLYVFQRSLADGIPIASEVAKLKGEKGPAKKYGGYAAGGQIGGWSPHSRADNIPAMLTAKEWVHPVDAVDYYGEQIMGAIQHRQVPREVLAGFARGQLGKMGDLPLGLAGGGQVAPIDTSTLWRFIGNMGHTRIPSKSEVASKVPAGGAAGPFLRAQDGKPYIWASAGPKGYDCSGIVSAVYNLLHGRNPYSHTFSTGSLPGQWFPKSGIGGPLTAAWSNPGESPASSTTGHMMGMVNGLTFESSGSRGVHLGKTTRRLTDFAHIAHYGLGGRVLPGSTMDDGGFRVLQPGLNLIRNGTGRPEPIGGPAAMASMGDVHIHLHGAVIASERQAVEMVTKAYNTAVRERKIVPGKRS